MSSLLLPLNIHSPQAFRSAQPITAGIPFPEGTLTAADRLALVGPDGRAFPLQTTPLAYWGNSRTVKWLLLDFIAPAVEAGVGQWQIHRMGPQDGAEPGGLRIQESADEIHIDTGAASFRLNRSTLPSLHQAAVSGQELLQPGSARGLLVDEQGKTLTARVDRCTVESRGPVRATVRLEGFFAGNVCCRFVARLCFFAQTGLVQIRWTIHNPRRARHPGGLWDLGDPGSLLFRDLSLELALAAGGQPRASWRAEPGQEWQSDDSGSLEVYQDSSGGENWQSRNHVNRQGRVPCSFRGYRVQAGGKVATGLRASPVVSLANASGDVSVALPEFWQQFPKAIEVEGQVLRVRLFPRQFADLFELQGGEQKTHVLWLQFGPPASAQEDTLGWVHSPARLHAQPTWYAESKALGWLAPADPATPPDVLLAEAIEGEKSLTARRELIDEYGWRNFGEIYADHENAYYKGTPPAVSHYNNQYDFVEGMLLQYLRSGDPRWYEVLDPLARHVIDIDIYHTNEDKAAYNGGLFWFTDHYLDAGACTHRTYTRANAGHNQGSYGGGPSSSHCFTTGLLHYYYLTGDPLAQDAVLSLADWILAMEDGSRTPFGMIDDGPTGLASCTGELNYQGPGRGCGNAVTALLDAWLLTGASRYLEQSEVLIRRCVHPADDVAGRQLLDIEKRWSYTIFFAALARYLTIKAEAGQFDFMYAYVQSSLLAYARWMLAHERPYFDHPEQMEFPTESWACQDLRKANVLRYAAAHAHEPLRSQFLRRGQELADRAWKDLLGFSSRHVARAVVLTAVEGIPDHYFRTHTPEPAPQPDEGYDFGSPTVFVPQKQRVFAQLKSPRGLLRALGRMADVRRWLGRRTSAMNPCSES